MIQMQLTPVDLEMLVVCKVMNLKVIYMDTKTHIMQRIKGVYRTYPEIMAISMQITMFMCVTVILMHLVV